MSAWSASFPFMITWRSSEYDWYLQLKTLSERMSSTAMLNKVGERIDPYGTPMWVSIFLPLTSMKVPVSVLAIAFIRTGLTFFFSNISITLCLNKESKARDASKLILKKSGFLFNFFLLFSLIIF